MAMEMDDDVFFEDLSKQISLLIMDEEEEVELPAQPATMSVPVQSYAYAPQSFMPPPFAYEMSCRRETKGTGVFIPRSSCPRRKSRSGKSSSINNSSQKQQDRQGVAAPHNIIYMNSCKSSSGVPKRLS